MRDALVVQYITPESCGLSLLAGEDRQMVQNCTYLVPLREVAWAPLAIHRSRLHR
jgi:hypothetical protein